MPLSKAARVAAATRKKLETKVRRRKIEGALVNARFVSSFFRVVLKKLFIALFSTRVSENFSFRIRRNQFLYSSRVNSNVDVRRVFSL